MDLRSVQRPLKSRKHAFVSTKFNLSGKWGDTDQRYVDLLNRLAKLRGPARYLHDDFSLNTEETSNMLDTAEDMFKTLRDIAPQRHRISDAS